MEKIFEQYGGVIVTVIAIIALIVIVKFLVWGTSTDVGNPTGLLSNQFNTVISGLTGKFDNFLKDVKFGTP